MIPGRKNSANPSSDVGLVTSGVIGCLCRVFGRFHESKRSVRSLFTWAYVTPPDQTSIYAINAVDLMSFTFVVFDEYRVIGTMVLSEYG